MCLGFERICNSYNHEMLSPNRFGSKLLHFHILTMPRRFTLVQPSSPFAC